MSYQRSCQQILLSLPLLGSALFFTSAHAMQPMADEEMSNAVAQDGVSLRLELLINAKADGSPMDGTGDEQIDCADPSDPCRFAMQFAGRDNKWLVFKGYSGILRINDIRLDAQAELGAVGSNPAYFNVSKFQGIGGGCLLPGGCTVANLNVSPALRVSYPDTTPGFVTGANPAAQVSSGFTSLEIGIALDGIAVEFGNESVGPLANANNPFLGLNVGDVASATAPAKIAIGGNALIFGF
ncbi:MAG: hypothetical protein P1U78_09085 [Alcanivoracaceae bacterium]|nr:hypothetical protein [Alcanivoracaceae bacterium]